LRPYCPVRHQPPRRRARWICRVARRHGKAGRLTNRFGAWGRLGAERQTVVLDAVGLRRPAALASHVGHYARVRRAVPVLVGLCLVSACTHGSTTAKRSGGREPTTLRAFVGLWHRHVTVAEFHSDGTGAYRTRAAILPDGRQVEEERNLALTVGPTGSSMDATVVSVRFVTVTAEGAESPVADPSPNESARGGRHDQILVRTSRRPRRRGDSWHSPGSAWGAPMQRLCLLR